jgi:hypothetical protein
MFIWTAAEFKAFLVYLADFALAVYVEFLFMSKCKILCPKDSLTTFAKLFVSWTF